MKDENKIFIGGITFESIGVVLLASPYKVGALIAVCIGFALIISALLMSYRGARIWSRQSRIKTAELCAITDKTVASALARSEALNEELRKMSPSWVPDTQLELPLQDAP